MTSSHPALDTQTLFITDAKNVASVLDTAVEKAVSRAMANPGQGILVTRHDHNTFSVKVTDDVPAGMTYERDLR